MKKDHTQEGTATEKTPMETFMENVEEEYFFEGEKLTSYFDATTLPDAPKRQLNAEGNTTYTMFLVFPSKEELVRAIFALTVGTRKSLAAGAKLATVNGAAILKDGLTLLEHWEQELVGIHPKEGKEEADPDEAQAPI
jgi:hypothetical protein